jgi:hypothetical protein
LKIKPALRLSFIISLFYFIFLFFKKKKMKGDTRHNWPSGDMADIKCQKKKETEQNDTNRTQPVWGVDFGCQPAKPSGRRRRKKKEKNCSAQ